MEGKLPCRRSRREVAGIRGEKLSQEDVTAPYFIIQESAKPERTNRASLLVGSLSMRTQHFDKAKGISFRSDTSELHIPGSAASKYCIDHTMVCKR